MTTPSPITLAHAAYTALQKELDSHTPKRLSEYQSPNREDPTKIDYFTINVDMVNENEGEQRYFPRSAHVRITAFTQTTGATRPTLTITVGEFSTNAAITIPLDSSVRTVEDTIADVLDAYRMVVWRDEYDTNLQKERQEQVSRRCDSNEKVDKQ